MLLWIFFSLLVCIAADGQFYFGVLNHHTQWQFHCPGNLTKFSNPPTNEQPLISYECPYPSLPIEIVPVELDLTFLCRLPSRLIWIIVDLYQYNTFSWLIDSKEIDIRVQLNNQISLTDFKSEMTNYTYRLILINAFYLPFESIQTLADQPVEISIVIQHVNQLNRCEFLIRENSSWQTFLDEQCHSNRSKTLSVEYARCHFVSNRSVKVTNELTEQDAFSLLERKWLKQILQKRSTSLSPRSLTTNLIFLMWTLFYQWMKNPS